MTYGLRVGNLEGEVLLPDGVQTKQLLGLLGLALALQHHLAHGLLDAVHLPPATHRRHHDTQASADPSSRRLQIHPCPGRPDEAGHYEGQRTLGPRRGNAPTVAATEVPFRPQQLTLVFGAETHPRASPVASARRPQHGEPPSRIQGLGSTRLPGAHWPKGECVRAHGRVVPHPPAALCSARGGSPLWRTPPPAPREPCVPARITAAPLAAGCKDPRSSMRFARRVHPRLKPAWGPQTPNAVGAPRASP